MGISATFLRGTCFGFSEAAFEGRAASGPMARIMNTNVKTLFKWTDGVRIGCLQRTSSGYLSAKTISVVGGLAIPFLLTSRSPRVRVFDSETILVKLCRVRSHQTREALSGRINHEQITVRTIVPAQANVGARSLSIGGIHLDSPGERPKTCER